jgi:hypothetical protein
MGKITPVVLWGEHRSTEILPVRIKDELQSDDEIMEHVKFIRYKLLEKSDYVNLLKEWDSKCRPMDRANGISVEKSWERFQNVIWEYIRELAEYERYLVKRHGPWVFNLHSRYSTRYDAKKYPFQIKFLFNYDKDRLPYQELEKIIFEVNKKHGLKIGTDDLLNHVLGSDTSIPMVEFALHDIPERGISYHSDRVKRIIKGFKSDEDYGRVNNLKCVDGSNWRYKKAVEEYSSFMKDFLLELTRK